MITHYITMAGRNLIRNKLHSILNLLGLATGITCFILILIFVKYELSYDRFNTNSDRIYRIAVSGMLGNTEIHQTGTPPPLPKALYTEFPEVESVTRVIKYTNVQGNYEKKIFTEDNLFIADSSFTDIFSVQFIRGDKASALNQPGVMLITDRTARKYFGDEDPINKTIIFMKGNIRFDIRISGLIREMPPNSHFHPDFIVSLLSFKDIYDSGNWFNNISSTYLRLKAHSDYKTVQSKFPSLISRYFFQGQSYDDWEKNGNYWRYSLQPLTKIHLTSKLNGEFESNGNATYIYILSLAAIFLLIIACINYMNLYSAKSFIRATEIGVRKSFGSTRFSLISQLLTESILLTFIAVCLALFVVESILPAYRNFTGKPLMFHYFDPATAGWLIMFTLVVGIFSGSYPAFHLSSLKPVVIFKQKSLNNNNNLSFRNILVIIQFSISICLIAGTILVYKQLQYLRDQHLGFDKENVVVVKNISGLGNNINAFMAIISSFPQMRSVTISSDVFGSPFINWGYGAEGKQTFTLNTFYCDTAYANVLKLELAEGRFFSPGYSSDSSGIVINETAAKLLEWDEPLDKQVELYAISKKLHIIGVIKDFSYESKQTQVRPMGIILLNGVAKDSEYTSANFILARLAAGKQDASMDFIKHSWYQFSNGEPFKYSFLDEEYNNLYRNEEKAQQLFILFAILSIFIACLGLYGLSSYLAMQRTKEIGVRKVNGARISQIMSMLNKDFVKWVIIAFSLSTPVSWYFMNKWLHSFAYKTDLSWWIFASAGIFSLLIAVTTVSWQSWRAATRNPVEALRYE